MVCAFIAAWMLLFWIKTRDKNQNKFADTNKQSILFNSTNKTDHIRSQIDTKVTQLQNKKNH